MAQSRVTIIYNGKKYTCNHSISIDDEPMTLKPGLYLEDPTVEHSLLKELFFNKAYFEMLVEHEDLYRLFKTTEMQVVSYKYYNCYIKSYGPTINIKYFHMQRVK